MLNINNQETGSSIHSRLYKISLQKTLDVSTNCVIENCCVLLMHGVIIVQLYNPVTTSY